MSKCNTSSKFENDLSFYNIKLQEFKKQILFLENEQENEIYQLKTGKIKILFTSVHSMEHTKENGDIKVREPFTKAIAKYVALEANTYCFLKLKSDGVDSNYVEEDEYKNSLIKIINENNIDLVIDIHGASINRNFDVELGTMNNLSADFSTINELKEAFTENGIKNVEVNSLFKGGMITQTVYGKTNIEVVQMEINKKFREIENIELMKKLCDSIINFVNQYYEITTKNN